jgi:hypothetical protein
LETEYPQNYLLALADELSDEMGHEQRILCGLLDESIDDLLVGIEQGLQLVDEVVDFDPDVEEPHGKVESFVASCCVTCRLEGLEFFVVD